MMKIWPWIVGTLFAALLVLALTIRPVSIFGVAYTPSTENSAEKAAREQLYKPGMGFTALQDAEVRQYEAAQRKKRQDWWDKRMEYEAIERENRRFAEEDERKRRGW